MFVKSLVFCAEFVNKLKMNYNIGYKDNVHFIHSFFFSCFNRDLVANAVNNGDNSSAFNSKNNNLYYRQYNASYQ